ncbi:unnamed protein product [Kuraishia capsulata CBS 1993]|uniref:Uncharacterized protein n=1 Tax=Kuraishia capsulata CBS 1993 TaxID=1382522 RepID=W6MR58_9ASCO|nr:uncharacterized protein KUCA_T00004828001 [Kuraishia capsulata CBS 1993]CDK28843.1 unnamed protein product [Kuraishia capsulata CBS 1993]
MGQKGSSDSTLSPADRSKEFSDFSARPRTPSSSTKSSPICISPVKDFLEDAGSPTPRKRVYGQGRRSKYSRAGRTVSRELLVPFRDGDLRKEASFSTSSQNCLPDDIVFSPERFVTSKLAPKHSPQLSPDPFVRASPKSPENSKIQPEHYLQQTPSPRSPTVSLRVMPTTVADEKGIWDFFDSETALTQISPRKRLVDRSHLSVNDSPTLMTPSEPTEPDFWTKISSKLQDSLSQLEEVVMPSKKEARVSTIPAFSNSSHRFARTYGMTRSFRMDDETDRSATGSMTGSDDEFEQHPIEAQSEPASNVHSLWYLKSLSQATNHTDEIEYLLECFSKRSWGSVSLRRSSLVEYLGKMLRDTGFSNHVYANEFPKNLVENVILQEETDAVINGTLSLILTDVLSRESGSRNAAKESVSQLLMQSKYQRKLAKFIKSQLESQNDIHGSYYGVSEWDSCLEIVAQEISSSAGVEIKPNEITPVYLGTILLKACLYALENFGQQIVGDLANLILELTTTHIQTGSYMETILTTELCSILEQMWSTGALMPYYVDHLDHFSVSINKLLLPLQSRCNSNDPYLLRFRSQLCKLSIVICTGEGNDGLKCLGCNYGFVDELVRCISDSGILMDNPQLIKAEYDYAMYSIGLLFRIADDNECQRLFGEDEAVLSALKLLQDSAVIPQEPQKYDARYYFSLIIGILSTSSHVEYDFDIGKATGLVDVKSVDDDGEIASGPSNPAFIA